MTEPSQNANVAPFPDELARLVESLEYRPRWHVQLGHWDRGQGSEGLTFRVTTRGYDTYHPEAGENYGVHHDFPVPPASFNRESWQRWLLDRLIEVETHEACEFFQIDGKRPFAPNHGPGWNPYGVRELNTAEAAETTFRGERREGTQQVEERQDGNERTVAIWPGAKFRLIANRPDGDRAFTVRANQKGDVKLTSEMIDRLADDRPS